MFILVLRWLTLGLWLSWLVVYWEGGRRIVGDIRQSVRAANSYLDTGLMIAIALLSLALFMTGLLISLRWLVVHPWVQNGWVALLGTFLTLVGMSGTFYCRHYLGRFWTAEAALQASHQVVDSGPYGVVRHPIYTAALVMYLGTGLVFATWWNWLACGLVMVAYILKARYEDMFLAANLPGYPAYQQRVRYQLIPGVW